MGSGVCLELKLTSREFLPWRLSAGLARPPCQAWNKMARQPGESRDLQSHRSVLLAWEEMWHGRRCGLKAVSPCYRVAPPNIKCRCLLSVCCGSRACRILSAEGPEGCLVLFFSIALRRHFGSYLELDRTWELALTCSFTFELWDFRQVISLSGPVPYELCTCYCYTGKVEGLFPFSSS